MAVMKLPCKITRHVKHLRMLSNARSRQYRCHHVYSINTGTSNSASQCMPCSPLTHMHARRGTCDKTWSHGQCRCETRICSDGPALAGPHGANKRLCASGCSLCMHCPACFTSNLHLHHRSFLPSRRCASTIACSARADPHVCNVSKYGKALLQVRIGVLFRVWVLVRLQAVAAPWTAWNHRNGSNKFTILSGLSTVPPLRNFLLASKRGFQQWTAKRARGGSLLGVAADFVVESHVGDIAVDINGQAHPSSSTFLVVACSWHLSLSPCNSTNPPLACFTGSLRVCVCWFVHVVVMVVVQG